MRTFILTLLVLSQLMSRAQVAVSSGSYIQNFGTAAVNSWANNTTYPGWYMVGTFQSHLNITTAPPSNTGGFYTYECNNNGDQKIGSRASGGSGTLRYGVVLQNTTGSALSHIRVTYKGYQLSLAQNGATNVITFDYIVGTTPPSIGASGGTGVAALNFTQLQSNGSSGSNQVQGYPCTQMANLSACITVNVPNNAYILLRWTDVDDAGNDHHMAIDDVDVQFLATNLSVNSATICSTQNATLTATGATNYTWSPATGLSAATGSMVTANPSSTTTYTVSGSVSSCPSKTVTSTVTINAAAPVVVASQTVCSGGTTTLTASGSTTYSWSPATGLSGTSGSSVTANPSSTTVYTITGAGGSCPATPGTATVTVLPAAVLSAASQTICSGGSATLSASGATNYTWSPATGLSSASGSTVSANPANTTVYTIQGANGACAASPLTLTLTVIPNPVVTVNSATICASGTANLTASGATTYTWGPAAGLSSVNGNAVNANPATTTVYTVSGAQASCVSAPASATVTVLQVPVIAVNSASICGSGSAVLSATGANSYTWSPAATLNTPTGSVVVAAPAATTAYTVTGSIGTCTAQAISTVSVAPFQSAAFSYGSNSYCNTSPNAIPIINGSSGGLFTALSPDLPIDQVTGIIAISQAPAKTYTVTYTTQGVCPDAQNFVLSISSSPSLSVGSATSCAGQASLLTAVTSPGGGTFQWLPGNATTPAISVSPSSTTNYTLTYTFNGCSETKITQVMISPQPVAAIAPSSSPVIEGQMLSLVASGGDTYLWDNGSSGSTITLQPQETRDYCVTVTNSYGCKERSCITVEMIKESTLYIPNTFTPNGDGLNDLFEIPHANLTEFQIRIFDRWGELLFESNSTDTSWDGTYKGKEVSEDVYVYTITAKGFDQKEYVKRGHVTVLK